MTKKILAILLIIALLSTFGVLFASAEYAYQDEITSFSNYPCEDGYDRTLYIKRSCTIKPAFYNGILEGYGSLMKNSNTSTPTYKECYGSSRFLGGEIMPRKITIKAAVSADDINANNTLTNASKAEVTEFRYSGKIWTAFYTSEVIYTTSTVEY